MSNKTIKTLTTSTAIALASVGGTAFAQEAQATPVPSNTAVNEPALVTKPQVKPLEKSEVPAPSTVKPALDAQKAVVKDAKTKIDTAKADVKAKEATVASTEQEVATAKQAVKDAEAIASEATPEKVAQVKDAQAKNVDAQKANQTATEATNEQIKAETKALSDEQAKVATAQGNLDQATKDVQTAEQAVTNAQSALDGTGLASAQKDLTQAQTDVKDATKAVEDAKTAKENASKADANRAQAIKSAETDVNTKNDAVKLAKDKLASATEHATNVENKLQSAQAELKSAQDKLVNTGASKDVVQITNPTIKLFDDERQALGTSATEITFKEAFDLWMKKDNDISREILRTAATNMSNESTIKINENDKNRPVDLNNLTDDQLVEISEFYAKLVTQLNHNFGYNASKNVKITQKTLNRAKSVAKKYEERSLDPDVAGHIRGNLENLTPIGSHSEYKTMYDLKYAVKRAFELSSFEDEPSNWGHLRNNLSSQAIGSVAITVANINGKYWMITNFGSLDSNDQIITKETDTASLEKAVETAKSNLAQAETASENAKQALTQASTDYASALSLKTETEKVLADAMATPLQAQVAENNLRLAEIALENAKTREAKANDAVANFSANLADKKSALEKAQDALKEAKTVQKSASQALADATAQLRAQEDKVKSLKEQSDKLLAEKDDLVKEAKELADKLQAYLDAPAKLATAKDEQSKAEAKLAQAKAELTTAKSTLENLLSAYRTEHAKLVDLQTEYDKLVDLAEKAQENVVAKLPDGTVIAVPKVAPTAEALPEVNIEELQKALATGKEVTLDAQGKVVVKEPVSIENNKPVNVASTYTDNKQVVKQAEAKKAELPNTGESTSTLGVFGLIGVLTGFGLASRKNKEN